MMCVPIQVHKRMIMSMEAESNWPDCDKGK